MTHLSARLVWHDTGWNGRICQAPHLNASCIVHEIIREKKDDAKERGSANIPVCDLPGWMPPCSRDILTYSPKQASLPHSDQFKIQGQSGRGSAFMFDLSC